MARKQIAPAPTGDATARAIIAGGLAWLLPGLGHWYLGHKHRAIIFLIVTSVTFWAGVAIGGVRTTVTPRDNGPWIAAQLCMGPEALVALYMSNNLALDAMKAGEPNKYKASWPSSNISVVYAGIAGMLNVLVMIDAIARADGSAHPEEARPPPAQGT